MINRTLIRIKIVQLLYAYYQAGDRFVESAEEELEKSMAKAYELYNYLLQLMIDITRMADEIVNDQEERNRVARIDAQISHRFIDNRFIAQLSSNKQLMSYIEQNKLTWAGDRDLLRKLYAEITESEYYAEYMMRDAVDYTDDRELWRKAYKNVIMKAEYIDETLEDKNIYWNDDKETIDTFVLKTIKRFEEANGEDQPLIPAFKDNEDHEFATTLIRRAVENSGYYQSLISQSTRNWEFNRLAYMDVIIMQIALAEMLTFPEIPVSVTINEYVELAKCYSTPKSHIYINGILDNIAKRLISEHKILKN
ncbi:MAG: transcription antitermination factor NusB [Bacteroidaceae bacterium]|nr:transcription antitermination factor NusB [Bacteroidaceae bacterium]MBQ9177245.1 transcription antitermination factor NusB [Bacteroidaceae bacterium]MBR1378138.1 transcription antitermination factor NusB [Bacteroidaceae bacterium]